MIQMVLTMKSLQRRVFTFGSVSIGLMVFTACGSPTTESAAARPAALPAAEEGGAALQWSSPPTMQIDPSKSYEAVFMTQIGDFRVRLFSDQAPVTVNNFVFLAKQGYYDNTTFHRVLPGFMAQGGDPTGTGGGGPGYTFDDEFDPDLQFDKAGLLAMANRGPNTNGGQFFITHTATDWLNGKHGVFGKLVEGDDVLTAIRITDNGEKPSKLNSVEIRES